VLLGVYFLVLQGLEYTVAAFRISTGAYGRIFFFGTGFHGMHVCLGRIILIVRRIRLNTRIITAHHHFGVEFRL
jgi:cytochrome c oxidase subunit 3